MLNVANIGKGMFNYRAFSQDLVSKQYGVTDVIKRSMDPAFQDIRLARILKDLKMQRKLNDAREMDLDVINTIVFKADKDLQQAALENKQKSPREDIYSFQPKYSEMQR